MKEHPIIFTGDRPTGIIEGRITQTRRIVMPQPFRDEGEKQWVYRYPSRKRECLHYSNATDALKDLCPYGQVGDTLWVRETHARWSNERDNIIYSNNPEYAQLGQQNKLLVKVAQKSQECSDLMEPCGHWEKVPSIFMPRWAARIFLEITNIRVERVQDINLEDCKADNAKRGFSWDKNPWVWVVEFKKLLR